jgi:hypothetical protein
MSKVKSGPQKRAGRNTVAPRGQRDKEETGGGKGGGRYPVQDASGSRGGGCYIKRGAVKKTAVTGSGGDCGGRYRKRAAAGVSAVT